MKLNWENLANGKCPKCNECLNKGRKGRYHKSGDCDFKIGSLKFERIKKVLFAEKKDVRMKLASEQRQKDREFILKRNAAKEAHKKRFAL